ncbi:MAG: glycosyltransferase family 4 protein [Candidatus Thorarchaeota archaeon]
MSIYVDVSAAVHARAGLGRYADSLSRALLREAPGRFAFFFNRSGASRIPSWLRGHSASSVRAGYKPWRMAVWLGQLAHVGFDRLVPDCELFHATEHLLLPLRHCPTVLTVHDLIFYLFPQHHKRLNRWYLNAALPLFCRRAHAVICVSEHSKADLVRFWGIKSEKIHVVYEAADSRFRPVSAEQVEVVRDRYGLPKRFLLTVGTIEPRKNLSRLLDALALLRQQGNDASLVIVGMMGWLYTDLMTKLEQSEHRDAVVMTGFVPDADLPAVYGGATVTVVASLYEGFGLPILESMSCGTPVVSSCTSSLPEIGGKAVRYFDPEHTVEMAHAIAEVWRSAELRQEMRQQGLARAEQFTWQRAAQETMRIYARAQQSEMAK